MQNDEVGKSKCTPSLDTSIGAKIIATGFNGGATAIDNNTAKHSHGTRKKLWQQKQKR